jgi:capsular exopolysaccharide synthesis family protein
MFTSAFPSEGKSVTTSNTAVALAQSGATVALINADLRRPSLERLFGLDNSKGLSLFLAGDEVIEPYQPEGIENLWVFSAGPEPANSAELLGSDRLTTLIKQLDCPPVLSAADPLVVAPQVDGVIVVVDSRTTETDDLLQVRADLANAGAKILGSVMNRDRRRRGSRWRSRAYSYYGRAES